jgi:hypothetical protein
MSMSEAAAAERIEVGQIWREVDPRRERFVRVLNVSEGVVKIRTVNPAWKHVSGRWKEAYRSRPSYAEASRFNGKRGGYALHEAPTP